MNHDVDGYLLVDGCMDGDDDDIAETEMTYVSVPTPESCLQELRIVSSNLRQKPG